MKSAPILMKFGHKVRLRILNDNLQKFSFCDLKNDLESDLERVKFEKWSDFDEIWTRGRAYDTQ